MENNNQQQNVVTQTSRFAMISVMLCFFAMGFVDLVGTASNYVKQDLGLSDTLANFLPSLVFFWFLIFSVPTGVLMNKIGRKKTVMLSLIVTFVSLLLPIFSESFPVMLVSFSLLGIGNTLMQTSLNPLVSQLVKGHLASTLTFGQFIKAIASFLAPIIASWGAAATIPDFGLGWRVLFPIYMVVGILASVLLQATSIKEEKGDNETEAESKSLSRDYIDTFKLLGNPYVLLCFFGIMCHVGIDVGTNTTAPKLLQEYAGMGHEPLLHLPYAGLSDGQLFPPRSEDAHVLHNLRCHDGLEHGLHVHGCHGCRRHRQAVALRRHSLGGLWQQQRLLHVPLSGHALYAGKEKRH